MYKDIFINVSKLVASPSEKNYEIVAGNSDYILKFTFDSEWDDRLMKTLRVVYGNKAYESVFQGNEVPFPVLPYSGNVSIGVYSGDIHTTTSAVVRVIPSITSSDPIHEDPPEDVYNQILAKLNELGDLLELRTDVKDNIVAALNEVYDKQSEMIRDHDELSNRDIPNQHPISAIEGLSEELERIWDAIPIKISDLANDANYITEDQIPVRSVNRETGDVLITPTSLGVYVKPYTGIPKGDLNQEVRDLLNQAGTVKSVNGIKPDSSGNVTLP